MHAVDTIGIEEDWPRLVDFSEIIDYELSNLDT